jgi:hypothetical protein
MARNVATVSSDGVIESEEGTFQIGVEPITGDVAPDDPGMAPEPSDIFGTDQDGLHPESSQETIREFLTASMDQERASLRKLMKYLEKHGDTIRVLRTEYEAHQSRTARLYKLATRGLVSL